MTGAGEKQVSPLEKIIVALDVPSAEKAMALIKNLPEARWFKVGLELFTASGPSLLEFIRSAGYFAFLDLKLHDIPNTVAAAIRAAVRHGASMLTIHASGGREMMRRAAEAAAEEASRTGITRPKLIGVTVLTSLTNEDLKEVGFPDGTETQVLRLARLAQESKLDGSVCSPHEISRLRGSLGPEWLIVTPGIRPSWTEAHDQKRIMTPAEALALGADYLVIGRPITGHPDPAEAFRLIVSELKAGR